MARSRSRCTRSGFPLPFTVEVRHREDAGVDAFGNATRSWGAPESVRVAGWCIDSSDEYGPDDRDVRRVDWAGSLLPVLARFGLEIKWPSVTPRFLWLMVAMTTRMARGGIQAWRNTSFMFSRRHSRE